MGGVDKLTRNPPIGDLGLSKYYLLLDFFFFFVMHQLLFRNNLFISNTCRLA